MRAGAAVSRAEDVRLAARDAATRALDAGGLDEAACLIVAATPEHLDEAVELCEALRDAAGANAQIVGGATSAALVPATPRWRTGRRWAGSHWRRARGCSRSAATRRARRARPRTTPVRA